jgi:hypothetical protein
VSDCVEMSFTYSARADGYGINLIVERTVINFVREMIPDGQMAGMMGHRPVENEQSFTFTLHPAEAEALRDDLSAALDQLRQNEGGAP